MTAPLLYKMSFSVIACSSIHIHIEYLLHTIVHRVPSTYRMLHVAERLSPFHNTPPNARAPDQVTKKCLHVVESGCHAVTRKQRNDCDAAADADQA